MSLRSLLADRIDESFRGQLNQEYIRDANGRAVRLRPGGYDRAIERTLSRARNLTRYDPRIFREQIAPRVRESLNAARRLNAGYETPAAFIPWIPGQQAAPGWNYQYVVRGRIRGRDGTGRSQWTVVVTSDTVLTNTQLYGRAQALSDLGQFAQDYRTFSLGPGDSNYVEWSTVSAYRIQVI